MGFRPGRAKGPNVSASGGGGGGGALLQVALPSFHDVFDYEKPLWTASDVIKSADWQFDGVNNELDGIAENNVWDAFREGVEGDLDYALKLTVALTKTAGLQVTDGTITASVTFDGANIYADCTGEGTVTVALVSATSWVRIVRMGSEWIMYYRVADTGVWTQLAAYTKSSYFNASGLVHSGIGNTIKEVVLFENSTPERLRSDSGNAIDLTDGANIAVNAALGNIYDVTLGGNRQMDNPTNALDGQKIIFRVRQDVVGSRTLTWDTKYRFSTDLPAPTLSVAGGALDYLGFIYNEVDDMWDFVAVQRGY